jgi:hyperosmotically inducible protein
MKPILYMILAGAVSLSAVGTMRASDVNADNSAQNSGDRDTGAITPEKQSNTEADVKITRDIRRALVKDTSLSVYAHNLKIITTHDHIVYLRGAVGSSDDVSKIVSLAQTNSGGYPVKNQISITTK